VAETEAPEVLVCAACGLHITDEGARLMVGGAHEHTGTNPNGYTYRFGCFAEAPGCRPHGVPSKQATWFPGHWWYVQKCAGCDEHLGWLFFSEAPEVRPFYGLILDKLIAAEPHLQA
jgi:hypothetical protein